MSVAVKHTLVFASLFCLSVNCVAQVPVIKLSCSVFMTKRNISGALVGTNSKTVMLDVTQNEDTLFLISTDDDIRSVTTEKAPHIAEVTNYSSDTRWHLVNKSNDAKPTITKMVIDRNSGQLLYTQDFNSGQLFTEATGTCGKVDMQKKKF